MCNVRTWQSLDTLTHTVLGICLGDAIAGKQLGKKAMIYGALANNLPDADIIASLWAGHAENLLIHRGITHSIFVALILSPALAYSFQKAHPELSLRRWMLLWGSGMFIHIFIDAYTSYGTGWFEPFSHTRITFNALYIVDPFFTMPMLISAIALMVLRRHSERRMKWARNGIFLSALYLLFATFNKLYINGVVKENIQTQNIHCKRFMATPSPLNNFLWYIIVDSEDTLRTGYYSDFDSSRTVEFNPLKRNDSLLLPFKSAKEVLRLIQFSQGYYCLKKEDSSIVFNDMRFGEQGGWYLKDAPFVFQYNITDVNKSAVALQRGRLKAVSKDALKHLWLRLKGK